MKKIIFTIFLSKGSVAMATTLISYDGQLGLRHRGQCFGFVCCSMSKAMASAIPGNIAKAMASAKPVFRSLIGSLASLARLLFSTMWAKRSLLVCQCQIDLFSSYKRIFLDVINSTL